VGQLAHTGIHAGEIHSNATFSRTEVGGSRSFRLHSSGARAVRERHVYNAGEWQPRDVDARCLTFCVTIGCVADTITFRPDEDAARALDVLTRDGTPVSAAVRAALIDAARRRADASIRAEAEGLASDEQDRAEAVQVLRDMETLRAW
jgi:hypothetical protein